VKAAIGTYFTPELEKDLRKKLKPLLQKKETSAYVTLETDY
jgi:hypothetical protein